MFFIRVVLDSAILSEINPTWQPNLFHKHDEKEGSGLMPRQRRLVSDRL